MINHQPVWGVWSTINQYEVYHQLSNSMRYAINHQPVWDPPSTINQYEVHHQPSTSMRCAINHQPVWGVPSTINQYEVYPQPSTINHRPLRLCGKPHRESLNMDWNILPDTKVPVHSLWLQRYPLIEWWNWGSLAHIPWSSKECMQRFRASLKTTSLYFTVEAQALLHWSSLRTPTTQTKSSIVIHCLPAGCCWTEYRPPFCRKCHPQNEPAGIRWKWYSSVLGAGG